MSAPQRDLRFMLADRSHDAAIRALLRDSSMNGDVALSRRCEPSYFAAMSALGGESHTIIAIANDEVVCVGSINIRDRYINGRGARVGYLGQLRLPRAFAGRFDIVRRGYRFFCDLHPSLGIELCFTSLAADNTRAQRFLEAGVRGMPTYEPVAELITMLIRVRPAPPHADSTHEQNAVDSSRFQLAPCGSCDDNTNVALWDQRYFRQEVITRYSPRLALVRPLLNLRSRMLSTSVRLPPPGRVVASAFVTHLATLDTNATAAHISRLMRPASDRGIESLAVGFDARDPRVEPLAKRFRPYVYRTRLYTVRCPDTIGEPLDGRLFDPEIALL